MMRLLFCLLFPVVPQAQVHPALFPEECGGGVIRRTDRYEGRALSGYMNGGAELYHEYGFVALSVQEVVMPGGEEITVEVFHMTSPTAAYGIYSISRHGCAGVDTSLLYVCEGPYQAQGAAREFYVRIQSATDTRTAREVRLQLLRALIGRFGQQRVVLSSLFQGYEDVSLMCGPLGIQNGMPDLDDLLEGVEGYVLQTRWLEGNKGLLAEAGFHHAAGAHSFAERTGAPAETGEVRAVSGRAGWWLLWITPFTVRVLNTSEGGDVPARILRDQKVPGHSSHTNH